MQEIMNIKAYIKDIAKYPRISREEEIALEKRIKNGDNEAREALINANLGLVLYMASKYKGKGVNYEDLVSEGNIGLVLAASRWKLNHKTRFSTYAMFYIRKYIILALGGRNSLIRIPSNLSASTNSLGNKLKQINNEVGTLTSDQIKKKIGKKYQNHPVESILSAMNISYCGMTKNGLDGRTFDRTDVALTTQSFEEEIEASDVKEKSKVLLKDMLSKTKHGKIVESIYGLDGKKPVSVEQIAKRHGVSGQAVHGWKNHCFQKMRKHKGFKILREFVEAK